MNPKIEVLITGQYGYIANQLEQYLEKNDAFHVTKISLKNENWKIIDFSKYDVIVHLAGIVHQPKTTQEVYEKVNYELTVKLAKKAKQESVKQFIFFSTASVYGNVNGKITLATKEIPNSFYGKSKLEAEIELKKMEMQDFKVAIIRPPMVYGKGCKGNYVTLAKIAKKAPFFPNIENKRSMIYIENLCEFTKLLILNQETGIFYPQDEEIVNTAEMVKLIAKERNHKIAIVRFLNGFVVLGKHIPGKIGALCQKAFGDWYYDQSLSKYKENYCIKTLQEAIHETEN